MPAMHSRVVTNLDNVIDTFNYFEEKTAQLNRNNNVHPFKG
jgi:hypothetical protein